MLLAKGRSDNLPERRTPPEAEDTACSTQWHLDASSNRDSESLVLIFPHARNIVPNTAHPKPKTTSDSTAGILSPPQPAARQQVICRLQMRESEAET